MSKLSGNKPGQIRRREILELIKGREQCTIDELKAHFDVSIPTLYRDINELADEHLIGKKHGSVEYLKKRPRDISLDSRFEERMNRQSDAKEIIARKAVALLEEDDVIFLDSSTTVLRLVREFAQLNLGRLTIITNSCSIIGEFASLPPAMTLISIGGTYNPQLHSFLGGIATKALETLRINKLFFSAVGVSTTGAYTFHEDHAAFLGQIARRGTPVLLADSNKFEREALFRICELPQLGVLISNEEPPTEIASVCKKSNVQIF